MNKVKVRCSVCGKSFKTPSAKKTICPSCEAEAKRAKHQPAPAQAVAPTPAASASVDVRAALRAAQENQGQFGAYRPPATPPSPAQSEQRVGHAARNAALAHAQPSPAGKPDARGSKAKPKSADEPKPKQRREPKPRVVTKPFEPAPEQISAIRERYLQLAQPEFDGIRHQIATELGIPLKAVKSVIKSTREETHVPSWWERGGGLPSQENMEKIKELYVPMLPEPEVGVHKQIAAQLHLTNTSVYQAIGQIRSDLQLPRYTARYEENGTDAVQAQAEHIDAQPIATQSAAGE